MIYITWFISNLDSFSKRYRRLVLWKPRSLKELDVWVWLPSIGCESCRNVVKKELPEKLAPIDRKRVRRHTSRGPKIYMCRVCTLWGKIIRLLHDFKHFSSSFVENCSKLQWFTKPSHKLQFLLLNSLRFHQQYSEEQLVPHFQKLKPNMDSKLSLHWTDNERRVISNRSFCQNRNIAALKQAHDLWVLLKVPIHHSQNNFLLFSIWNTAVSPATILPRYNMYLFLEHQFFLMGVKASLRRIVLSSNHRTIVCRMYNANLP